MWACISIDGSVTLKSNLIILYIDKKTSTPNSNTNTETNNNSNHINIIEKMGIKDITTCKQRIVVTLKAEISQLVPSVQGL